MIRKARAVWRGSGRAGNGELSSDSGVLANTPYSYRTRFENEKGTNPEELTRRRARRVLHDGLGLSIAGRGVHAYGAQYRGNRHPRTGQGGFRISLSALTLRASVPNLDQDTFARLAQDAEQNCPVSRVLRAEITLDAKLV